MTYATKHTLDTRDALPSQPELDWPKVVQNCTDASTAPHGLTPPLASSLQYPLPSPQNGEPPPAIPLHGIRPVTLSQRSGRRFRCRKNALCSWCTRQRHYGSRLEGPAGSPCLPRSCRPSSGGLVLRSYRNRGICKLCQQQRRYWAPSRRSSKARAKFYSYSLVYVLCAWDAATTLVVAFAV
jgi:hypothetical protein